MVKVVNHCKRKNNKLKSQAVISTCIPSPAAHAGGTFNNLVTLTFDLSTTVSMHAEVLPAVYYIVYMYTKFGVDSSSRFFKARTHTHTHADTKTQTDATGHRIHASASDGVGQINARCE